MRGHRIGLDLFSDVLDVLDRHGFARGDDEHAGRAIFLIGDLARIYEGTQDHPFGPSVNPAPVQQTAPEPRGPDSGYRVILRARDRTNLLVALAIAADHARDCAGLCTDCPDRSCPSCESCLRDAQAYDQLADRIFQALQTAPPAHPSPARSTRQPEPADGKEAGQ
jgi:hypothetical protein